MRLCSGPLGERTKPPSRARPLRSAPALAPAAPPALITFVLINPNAKGGRVGRIWPELEAALRTRGVEFERRFTSEPGDGEALVRAAARAGARRFLVAGGDGTLNEAVNGLFEIPSNGASPRAPIVADSLVGILPMGSGGDFARTLGLPRSPKKALDRILGSAGAPCDVGRLCFVGHDGVPKERLFINIASFGIGGEVDRRVNRSKKPLGGTVAFAVASLQALGSYRCPPVSIALDEGPPRLRTVFSVAVANGRYFGAGMKIAPEARIDDGWFDVTMISQMPLWRAIAFMPRLYSGRLDAPSVERARARHIDARPEPGADPVLLDVDGEAPGRLPASFEILPRAVRVLA